MIVLITGEYGSGISFSQGVEKGSPAEVDNTTATYFMLLYSLLLLQDGGFEKMLVFDRTRPSPYSGISAAQSTYTTFH